MTDVKVIDAGTLAVSMSFEDGMKLCEKLQLLETMQHGEGDYARFTQKGINVVATLVQLLQQQAEAAAAGEVLKGS